MRELVERFYYEVWDKEDEEVALEILHPDLAFRGSYGIEKKTVAGFIEYLRLVHEALGDYRCTINDLVCEDTEAWADMTFRGIHRGVFLGVDPTGKEIEWTGKTYFKAADGRLTKIWVTAGTTPFAKEKDK